MKRTVKTYPELQQWTRGFADDRFDAFILVGSAGLGKSRIIKESVGDRARVIEGHATAFQLYRELYYHRDEPFIIDDVDQLYSDKDAVRLLKCLFQTEKVKNIAWHSSTHKLEGEEIPTSFETTTNAAIIANEWKQLNVNISAVEDRGVLINFKPTPEEVHEWVGGWYRKQRVSEEVYKFIGDHLHLISEPSGRHYIVGEDIRKADLDWRAALFETWGLDEPKIVVARLLANEAMTVEQRVAAFERQTKKSRATFFRLAKKLRQAG